MIRRRLHVDGIVQGVGFRPFVYRLAHELGLRGSVRNDPRGVTIEAEGTSDVLDRFAARIVSDAPPLARVDDVRVQAERESGLDADGFVRDVLVHGSEAVVAHHCHRPVIVLDPTMPLGHIIGRLQAVGQRSEDDVIDNDVVLLWGDEPRIITGADILGRLLRGISGGADA